MVNFGKFFGIWRKNDYFKKSESGKDGFFDVIFVK